MCVMVAQNDKFPGWDTLKNCWDNNPDGAGIMYQKNGKVIISKGFMSFTELKQAVMKIPNYQRIPLVYHFRIASHGKVSPQNTHPFPYSSSPKVHKALDLVVPVGIAHNGIVNITSYNNLERLKHDLTDTSQFLSEMYSSNIAINNGVGNRKYLIDNLEKESEKSHSRFCVMDSKSITTIGSWHDINGCKFSNNFSHLQRVKMNYNKKYGWVYEK